MKLISEMANFGKGMPGMSMAKMFKKQGLAASAKGRIGKSTRNPFLMGQSAATKIKNAGGKVKNSRTPAMGGMSLADGLTNVGMRKKAGLKK